MADVGKLRQRVLLSTQAYPRAVVSGFLNNKKAELTDPGLRTMALSHRTQILYLPDIAFITSYLHIKPGDTVVEAGAFLGLDFL